MTMAEGDLAVTEIKFVRAAAIEGRPPPAAMAGALGWVRANLLSTPTNIALSILIATVLAIPVSTTHAKTGAIVGVGATTRLSAVRWGIARRIVWAWILTIPASALLAAIVWLVIRFVRPT